MNPTPFSPGSRYQTFVPGFKLKPPALTRPRAFKSRLAWINGQMIPYDPANAHFLNPAGQDRTAVSAGIRCYATPRGPAVFRLHEQMTHFLQMAQASGLGEPRFTLEQLCQAVFGVIEGNGLSDCWVRPQLFFNADNGEPIITMAAWSCESFPAQEAMMSMRTGLNHHPRLFKSQTDADEMILFDQDGFVTEETGGHLFAVRDNDLYTSPAGQERDRIAWDTVITLAHDAGYGVVEKPLTRDDLFTADELFACGLATEVVAVCRVDDRLVGQGKMGQVTQIIQDMVANTVRGRTRRSLYWLEYVVNQPLF